MQNEAKDTFENLGAQNTPKIPKHVTLKYSLKIPTGLKLLQVLG